MFKIRRVNDVEPTAPGQVNIKKRSRVPGVMITQFVEEVPVGMSTPDFTRKPIALTIQEGKLAIFKARVSGKPAPRVSWARNNGEIDEENYKMVYDSLSGEHSLEIPEVSVEHADTYKCFATNEYGRAVVTAALNIIELGYKKSRALQQSRTGVRELPEDFKKALRCTVKIEPKPEVKRVIDDRFWELLLSSNKKHYERICSEYGVTDFRWMLKKLKEKKLEQEYEQEKVVERLCNLKPIEVKGYRAEMSLKDPASKILNKDGVLVPFDGDAERKLKQVGKKFVFSINDVHPEDAGMCHVEVDGVKIFSTELKGDNDQNLVGKKKARKTTRAGGGADLLKIAEEQQAKLQKERDELLATAKAQAEVEAKAEEEVEAKEIGDVNAKADVKPKEQKETTNKAEAENKTKEKTGTKIQAKEEKTKEKTETKIQAKEDKTKEKTEKTKEKLDTKIHGNVEETTKEKTTETKIQAEDKTKTKGDTKNTISEYTKNKAMPKSTAKTKQTVKVKVEKKDDSKNENSAKEEEFEAEDEESEEGDEMEEEDAGVEVEKRKDKPTQTTNPKVSNDKEDEEPVLKKKKRVRKGPLVPDTAMDAGVYFTSGLSDINAIIDTEAELICRLSSDDCEGFWYKDGKKIASTDDVRIVEEGSYRKLVLKNCKEEDAGKYRYEADGRKTEAMVIVEDPPRMNKDDLTKFLKPVIVNTGKDAAFVLSFLGREPMKIQWFNEGEELLEDTRTRIEKSSSHTRLLLLKCKRKTSGEIKIKIKNDFGTTEAVTQLTVLDKPTVPLGPVDIIESSANCIAFKWRPPKDNGGPPITNYILERQQIGRNSWKMLGKIGPEPQYRDSDVDHGRRYAYHIRAENQQGISEMMETGDIQAGTKAYPGPPTGLKIVSAFKDCINLAWSPPSNTGGTNILGYNVDKRKNSSNLWSLVNPSDESIKEKKYAAKDVIEGIQYEFRVSAINISGVGEPSAPTEFVFARDPKKPPGKVRDLKVIDSTYSTLSLTWTEPKVEEGVQDEAKGYFVEIRAAENPDWGRCNSSPIITNSFTILGLRSMAMYWVRVVATNEGGDGEPQELENYIIAMPPPVRPRFTDKKIKNFMVTRAGNSMRVTYNFQGSPLPTSTWLKDGLPLPKHVTVSNSDTSSQLMIPLSEHRDTGIYTLILRNIVGQESCTFEMRVTDDPKPPGPVELEENVPGAVLITWTASPDEKRDDRLHYMITKHDSVKHTWQTLADRLFNNKFTAVNILPGRQYKFRVYAKNDMGTSEPSESPKWEVKRAKGTFSLNLPASKDCSFEAAPAFSVPLKMHKTPESYECYMSCAVTGNPKPYVTWYRNNISLNTNSNYYITNTCGVCSMVILKVGPKDSGEYTVVAENALGRVECSTILVVKD
ncbi:immunoglobulin-like and fibronectin type III domain-containing protein 1 [Syngnathus acus]|uniref:immunoglobulin-like and fibronectin type III domain-containing protein 1 n=1 Tax=Syngnathus acus TaxID=161584 RepID=UPI001885CF5A|nr:immunoglobulin-like and fibronectin type III domain-containing protein 1 [Syngnathus acus]XP_037108341.1 immunoglobulin-like and fibronectin type III domain-containing protein 1 [Syngnathus acus]